MNNKKILSLEFKDGRKIRDIGKITQEIRERVKPNRYWKDLFIYDPYANLSNTIEKTEVVAAFNIIRRSKITPEKLLNRIHNKAIIGDLLRRIDSESELANLNDDMFIPVFNNVKLLIDGLTEIENVGIATATKILHLKRPKLIPILDSHIFIFYCYTEPRIRKIDNVMSDLRNDLKNGNNLRILIAIAEELSDLINSYNSLITQGRGKKVVLTPLRVFERLIWRYVKSRNAQ
jgi:hypothetical protein